MNELEAQVAIVAIFTFGIVALVAMYHYFVSRDRRRSSVSPDTIVDFAGYHSREEKLDNELYLLREFLYGDGFVVESLILEWRDADGKTKFARQLGDFLVARGADGSGYDFEPNGSRMRVRLGDIAGSHLL